MLICLIWSLREPLTTSFTTLSHKIQIWLNRIPSYETVRELYDKTSHYRTIEVVLLLSVTNVSLVTIYCAFMFYERMRISAKARSWSSCVKV